MAAHLHTQIRAAVVSALTGLTTSGARVYANRLMPLQDGLQPTLLVTLDEETAEVLTVHSPRTHDRVLVLAVSACAKAASGLDDTLDTMSKEVEVALSGGITVGGRTLDCIYTGMSFDDAMGDKPVGIKRMTFSIPYTAAANAPDVLT